GTPGRIGVHVFDDREPGFSHTRKDADRAQEPRGIVDQEQECCKAKYAETGRHERDELWHLVFSPVHRTDGEQQRKNEQTSRVSDNVVAHQYGGNDTRSHLSAGNLKRDKKRSKSEDDKA